MFKAEWVSEEIATKEGARIVDRVGKQSRKGRAGDREQDPFISASGDCPSKGSRRNSGTTEIVILVAVTR